MCYVCVCVFYYIVYDIISKIRVQIQSSNKTKNTNYRDYIFGVCTDSCN